MTARAEGSNAPIRRRTEKAGKRLKMLMAKYEAEGMISEEAKERAVAEMRDNPRQDWRAG